MASATEQRYMYDTCGIKNRINPEHETEAEANPAYIICEPWCTSCGYPPHICDPYFTRCTGTIIGRWFNEAENRWIEPDA